MILAMIPWRSNIWICHSRINCLFLWQNTAGSRGGMTYAPAIYHVTVDVTITAPDVTEVE
jgi:hypothetical protein